MLPILSYPLDTLRSTFIDAYCLKYSRTNSVNGDSSNTIENNEKEITPKNGEKQAINRGGYEVNEEKYLINEEKHLRNEEKYSINGEKCPINEKYTNGETDFKVSKANNIQWSPDGYFLSCIQDGNLRIYTIDIYNKEKNIKHTSTIRDGQDIKSYCWDNTSNGYNKDNFTIVTAGIRTPIHLWDIYTCSIRSTYSHYTIYDNTINTAQAVYMYNDIRNNNMKSILGLYRNFLCLFDVETSKQISLITLPPDRISWKRFIKSFIVDDNDEQYNFKTSNNNSSTPQKGSLSVAQPNQISNVIWGDACAIGSTYGSVALFDIYNQSLVMNLYTPEIYIGKNVNSLYWVYNHKSSYPSLLAIYQPTYKYPMGGIACWDIRMNGKNPQYFGWGSTHDTDTINQYLIDTCDTDRGLFTITGIHSSTQQQSTILLNSLEFDIDTFKYIFQTQLQGQTSSQYTLNTSHICCHPQWGTTPLVATLLEDSLSIWDLS